MKIKRFKSLSYKQHLTYLLIFSLGFLSACSKPEFKPSIDSKFEEQSLKNIQHHSTSFTSKALLSNSQVNLDANLHYVSLGNDNGTPVVMVHGTPGSWSTYRYIVGNSRLHTDFKLISIDRLSWGESTSGNILTPESFENQVDAIAAMIKDTSNKPVILVGHSLGASLAPKVAIDYPELVSGLILLAGSLDPELGKPRWYNQAASLPFMDLLVPGALNQANKEITLLQSGLNSYVDNWSDIRVPTTVIQGKEDTLVSPKNVTFAKQKLAHLKDKLRIIEIDNMGHFLPWEKTELIVSEIIAMKEMLLASPYNK